MGRIVPGLGRAHPLWGLLGGGIQKFTNDSGPAVLYNFEGDLLDSSGNGNHLLPYVGGAPNYTNALAEPTFAGVLFSGTIYRAPPDPSFQLVGDLTVELLFEVRGSIPANCQIVNCDGPEEDGSAGNCLYDFDFTSTSVNWFSESGSGTDTLATPISMPFPVDRVNYVAVTKQVLGGGTSAVSAYLNGVFRGTSVIPDTSGGSNDSLFVGGNGPYSEPGANAAIAGNILIGSFRISPGARTEGEVRRQYNTSLGGVYGYLD